MPTITGTLEDVAIASSRAVEVVVSAPNPRTSAGGVTTTEQAAYPVGADGSVSFPLSPGPAVLNIMGDDGLIDHIDLWAQDDTTTLKVAFENAQDVDDVGRLEQILTLAKHNVKSISGAIPSAQAAAASAAEAKASEDNAKVSETRAKTSETKAKASETAAAGSESAVAKSASNAKASETKAKASETAAAKSAKEASDSAVHVDTGVATAAGHASAAGTSASGAAGSASDAAESARKAKTSETAAATSASEAKASETAAAGSADKAEDSETLAVDGSAAAVAAAKALLDWRAPDPVTVMGTEATEDGTVVTMSDGSSFTVPHGARGLPGIDANPLTVVSAVTSGEGTKITLSDESVFIVPRGPQGPQGEALTITGTVASASALPTGPTAEGTATAIITADDGHLHVWSGSDWDDVGEIRGPQGPPGDGASTIEEVEGLGAALNARPTTTTVSGMLDPLVTGTELDDALSGALADLAKAGHTHTVADITDLPVIEASSNSKNTLVKRDAYGRITLSNAVLDQHAVTKRQMDAAVEAKADKAHKHAIGDVTGLQAAIDEAAGAATWGELQGKPSTFPPASHKHGVADINATGTRGSTTYLRGDGTWVAPPNTTYSLVSQAEAEAGTATTARTWSAQRVRRAVAAYAPSKGTLETGLAGKADKSEVPKTASDVGARPDTWTPTAEQVGARPATWTPTAAQVGARPASWTPTAAQVGARPATWLPGVADVTGLSAALAEKAPQAFVSDLQNSIDDVDELVKQKADLTQVHARPAMWLWDGSGTWSAPAGAVANDNVLNTATGEIWSIK